MKQQSIKRLLAAGILGCFIATSATAQEAPNAEVDANGNLVINPGTPEELIIAPPAGSVNASGDLVIGDQTFTRPTAVVLANGNLDLGGGNILEVPELPGSDLPPILAWFGDDLFKYNADAPYDENQWYFSFTYKNLYHFAANKWFYFEVFDATFFLANDSASGTRENGFWAFTRNLFPEQTDGTWVFISGVNGFQDLRVRHSVPDEQAGLQNIDGFLYIMDPSGYPDDEGEGFFFFGEFEDGNYITRFGVDNCVRLR
jgi:hypothetical protein